MYHVDIILIHTAEPEAIQSEWDEILRGSTRADRGDAHKSVIPGELARTLVAGQVPGPGSYRGSISSTGCQIDIRRKGPCDSSVAHPSSNSRTTLR